MKTYKFIEDCWYSSNGCDCCEPEPMYYYTPQGFDTNGTPHDVFGCYLACIEIEDDGITQEGWDNLYEFSESEIEILCRDKYGFEVTIEWLKIYEL